MRVESLSTLETVAKFFGWALLAAAAVLIAVTIKFAVDLYSDPTTSYAYEVVSSFLSEEEPLVSVSKDGETLEINISSESRLVIALFLGLIGLSISVSIFSGLISSAISLFNLSYKNDKAT